MKVDPFRLEVMKHQLSAVAEEMGAVLGRAAYSVNIKERKDFSCALFDGKGAIIAQAAHIPVHLGSMPMSVRAAIDCIAFKQGDTAILNHPYQGGTHLPDVTLIRPVFLGKELRFYTACRAHYSDIGGMTPGSMPLATDLIQEGLIIPPVLLSGDVIRLMVANVRNPREVLGDLAAQTAACATGEKRLLELVKRYRYPMVKRYCGALRDYAQKLVESAIQRIPARTFRFKDVMDGGVPIRVAIRRKGRRVRVDFTGSAPQVAGNINAVYAVTLSAVLYCFRCLVKEDIPLNAGLSAPIEVIAPEGTIVNARPPAAVTGGNVETSQRIVDVVFGALAKALPVEIPAASAGTMSNFSFGGKGFAYYETIAGGMGARPGARGVDAVQTHMTNTMNTPVEALEHAYPIRVRQYRVRRGSGGKGKHRGGDGIVREVEFLTEAEVSILSDRRESAPWGLAGGKPGKPGRDWIDGRRVPGKINTRVKAGQRVRIETPGGGGYGRG